jgi:hypothetical protein
MFGPFSANVKAPELQQPADRYSPRYQGRGDELEREALASFHGAAQKVDGDDG